MAIFHLNAQALSRKDGRSAIASAAYRAGAVLTDAASGEVFDFTKKGGIVSAAILLPDNAPTWAQNRQELWARAEAAERRGDACIAHEIEIALPHELTAAERQQLAHDFARHIVAKTGCAVDVAIHRPQKSKGQDERNHHAHLLVTERGFDGDSFAKKKCQLFRRDSSADFVTHLRETCANMTNRYLVAKGLDPISAKSHADRGISKPASTHDGWALTKAKRAVRRIERQLADVRQEIEQHPAAAAALAPAAASANVETVKPTASLAAGLYLALPSEMHLKPPSPFTRRPTKDKDEEDAARAAVRQQQEPPAPPPPQQEQDRGEDTLTALLRPTTPPPAPTTPAGQGRAPAPRPGR